jgi:hypothetical protein
MQSGGDMSTTKFFWSWLTYVVITFVMGFVWHLVLFKDLYARLGIFTRIDDPIIPLGLAAMFIQGAVLAYLYPLVARNGGVVREGIRFGLITGLFIASSAVVAEAAKQRVSSLTMWLTVESVYYALQFVLCGIAIALVQSRLKSRAA